MLKVNYKKDSLEYSDYLNLVIPIGNLVVIKKLEREEVLDSGIIIPATAIDDTNFGIVIGKNEGHWKDNLYVEHNDIEIGDIVVYRNWCEKEIKVKEKICYTIEYPEITGFIKKEYFFENK